MRLVQLLPLVLAIILVYSPDKLQCATDKRKAVKSHGPKETTSGVTETLHAVYDKLTHLLGSQKEQEAPITHDITVLGRELPANPHSSPKLSDSGHGTDTEEQAREEPVVIPVRDRYYPLVRREPLILRRKARAAQNAGGRIDPVSVPMLQHNPFPHLVRREPRIPRKKPALAQLSPALLTPDSFLGDTTDQEAPSQHDRSLSQDPSPSVDIDSHLHSPTRRASTESLARPVPEINMVRDFVTSSSGPIGSGSYGTVYLVKHMRSDTKYAFKVFFSFKRAKGPLTRQKSHGGVFNLPQRDGYNEFYILRELPPHPNIIQIAGVSYDRIRQERVTNYNSPDILFEYMDYGSLHDAIRGELSPIAISSDMKSARLQRVKMIMHGILTGLAYIHARDIVHRDIKPSNILLSEAGDVKLADFGLALCLTQRGNEQTGLSPYVYTNIYRAPEILAYSCDKRGGIHRSDSDPYGKPADLWAVGIIMIELYTGIRPFPTSDHKDAFGMLYFIAQNLLFSKKERPYSKLQKQWQSCMKDEPHAFNLLAGLLIRNPKDRITAAQALTHPYFEDVHKAC